MFSVMVRGGKGAHQGGAGENGTLTAKACPKGLYGIFCEVGLQYDNIKIY